VVIATAKFWQTLNNNLNDMFAIKIKITKFISDHQQGFVECIFNDAWYKVHIVHDKVPIVTEKYLDANSEYPQDEVIPCEILKESADRDGRTIFTVDTAKPWGVDTIEGLTEFDMLKEQLTELKS
jgi:hypothetical protein